MTEHDFYEAALRLSREGDENRAAESLRLLIERYPSSPLADVARQKLAALEKSLSDHPADDQHPRTEGPDRFTLAAIASVVAIMLALLAVREARFGAADSHRGVELNAPKLIDAAIAHEKSSLLELRDTLLVGHIDSVVQALERKRPVELVSLLTETLCVYCEPRNLIEVLAYVGDPRIWDAVAVWDFSVEQRARLLQISIEMGNDEYAEIVGRYPFDASEIDPRRLIKLVHSRGSVSLADMLARNATIPADKRNSMLGAESEGDWAPLMVAVYAGDASGVESLLDAGGKVNSLDSEGNSPLIAAALKGHAAITKLLVGRGADILHTNRAGVSAVEVAKYSGHTEVEAELRRLQREAVREAQVALYNLGYEPGPADGLAGQKTRAALREFQERFGLPADGRLSTATVQRLTSQPAPPGPWGGIGITERGASLGQWRNPTRHAARERAENRCKEAGKTCTRIRVFRGCGAMAHGPNGAWSWSPGDTLLAAQNAALSSCGKRGAACDVVSAWCADGRQSK